MASNDTLRQLLHLSNNTVTESLPLAGVAMGETAAAAAAAAAAALAGVHTALNASTTVSSTVSAVATTTMAAAGSLTNATLGPLGASTVSISRTSTLLDNFTTTVSAYICSPPAYKEFPPDLFTNEQRYHGAMILHFILVIYMFIALSIVCDEYFVTSLDKICERLGFGEDVAGATFMAAGSSAPELFASLIGVFVTKGDVGVGTIVGSAVFNILFVIGLCGLVAAQAVALSWWPLCRDSAYYSLSVVVLVLIVMDGVVTWYEAVIMLFIYGCYITLMMYNSTVQSFVVSKIRRGESTELLHANGTAMKNLGKGFGDYEMFNNDEDDLYSRDAAPPPPKQEPLPVELPADEYVIQHRLPFGFYEFIFRLLILNRFRGRTRFISAARLVILYRRKMNIHIAAQRRQQFKSAAQQPSVTSYTKSARSWFSTCEPDQNEQWKIVPNIATDGVWKSAKWVAVYPIRFAFYYTIPDCRKTKFERLFMVTFAIAILWIAVFSYIMVWMVTLIGFTFRIPDSVMGITFLAAGTSIPDAMASVYVVRQGMGDMAVSNSIGSNVFDILLGLALPWFIQTAMVEPGSYVHINSNGMVYSILLLFLTVIVTVVAIQQSHWTLNRYVGLVCLTTYVLYLLLSVMIECNVLGFVNLPMCDE